MMDSEQHQPGESGWDNSWIREILIRRASTSSSVACVPTSDPKRAMQLKLYLAACGDYARAPVFSFGPWRGLERLVRGENRHLYFQPVTQNAGEYAEMAGVHNRVGGLYEALRYMDEMLKQQRCLFIMEHLDGPRDEEKERHLLYALRDWADDPEVKLQGSLVVLVVGSVAKVLDDMTRGLAIVQQPPLATSQERLKTIEQIAAEFEVPSSHITDDLELATRGMNLHQLETALREAYQRTGTLSVDYLNKLKKDIIRQSELVEVAEASAEGFSSIGGYQHVKDFVIRSIVEPLQEANQARHLCLRLPRGFVLFGPPGTGKSLFARCLAGEIRLPIVNLRTEILFSKYLGESPRLFYNAIRLIEQMSPSIVFLDEIDKLLGTRISGVSDGASDETRKVQNLVLEWRGDKQCKSILVGATNRPQDLDDAAIRAQRIDYMIPMLYPDAEARREILRVHLGMKGNRDLVPFGVGQEEVDSLIKHIAQRTEDFTGAELEGLVNEAILNAFHARALALRPDDLLDALQSYRVDRPRREEQKRIHMQMAQHFATHTQFLS